MASIALIIPAHGTEFEQRTALQLLWEYKKRGHEVKVIKYRPIITFLRLLFSVADIFDFQGSRSAFCILVAKLRVSSTVVLSLHEQEEFRPGKFFLQRMNIRINTWLGIRLANQIVTTQKMLQYLIFRKFKELPSFVPQPFTEELKRKIGKRIVIIFSTKECYLRTQKIIKNIKGEIETLHIENEEDFSSPQNKDLLRRSHTILVLKPFRYPGNLRQITLHETPIIAIETPEHQEVLRNYASFIPGDSSRNIRLAVAKQDVAYRNAKANAKKLAQYTANLFSTEQIAEEYLHVYRKTKLQKVPLDSLRQKETA